MVTKITRDELKTKIERGDGLVIVEALPPMYYGDAHLPGALNLPHDQVGERASQLLPNTSQEIVVYCSNLPCQNSTLASRQLDRLGYSNVREYEEGKQDWIDAGLPVERGVPAAAI